MRLPTALVLAAQASAVAVEPRSDQAAAAAVGFPPVFNHGWCGLHLHIYDQPKKFVWGGGDVKLDAKEREERGLPKYSIRVHDAHHSKRLEQEGRIPGPGERIEISSGDLPEKISMWLTPEDLNRVYGASDKWTLGAPGTKDDRCSIGKWDRRRADFPEIGSDAYTVDLDCGFAC
ncbi:hypothetical protein PG985_009957 [Apiospora marii]|uniref:uncharacterized protein n=1 Tax=Apiospora marii TaxID=335849 RepID=UPI00312D4EA4